MAQTDETVAFSTIPVDHQVRLEDRVSYVYLEYVKVTQDRTGVVALGQRDEAPFRGVLQLPVSGIAVLILGPGTSITHAAVTSCARAGITVLFSGGGGIPAYTHATPLTSSSRWALAQAKLVSNERHQRDAAIILYKRQFGLDHIEGGTIRQMRGLEGQRMKKAYRDLARKHKISGFRRDPKGEDQVNGALNISNSMLYGCAAAACAAIGVNPSLGIIHRGDARSLLFDLADLYKPTITLPISFAAANAEDMPAVVRRQMRAAFVRNDMLVGMLDALMLVLKPHLPERNDDRLIGDNLGDEVEGHTQYGKED